MEKQKKSASSTSKKMVTLLSILLIYSSYFVSRFTRELSLSYDSMNTTDVPPLEKLSNKNNKDSNSELIVEEGDLPEQPSKNLDRECKQVYFWGGGKAGTSTMYSLIMHAGAYFHNATDLYRSPFIDIGKEYCWVEGSSNRNAQTWREHMKGKCNINNDIDTLIQKQRAQREKKEYVENEFVLDGCPRLTSVASAKKILDESGPNTKFIMLIRDPIERLISHLNDNRKRAGAKYNVEDQIKMFLRNKQKRKPKEIQLSMYGQNLQNLLTVFSKVQQQQQEKNILIVRTETINDTHTQDVFDAINDHIGAKRRVVEQVRVINRGNSISRVNPDFVYQGTISEQTRDGLKELFYSDVELLEKLVGRRFPWSWVDHTHKNSDSDVIDMSPWTTALV